MIDNSLFEVALLALQSNHL